MDIVVIKLSIKSLKYRIQTNKKLANHLKAYKNRRLANKRALIKKIKVLINLNL